MPSIVEAVFGMTEPTGKVIRVRGLDKRLGSTYAVIDADLDIQHGKALALISSAKVGGKTLLDTLVPAFNAANVAGRSFVGALDAGASSCAPILKAKALGAKSRLAAV